MNKAKTIIIFSLLGLLFISPVFAMSFPPIGELGVTETSTAAEFIVYFFNLAIAVGAFIAGVVLFMAGVDYISSRGEPAKIESAKNKIKNSFLGLIVLFSSFMILSTINSQLPNIKIDQLQKNTEEEIIIPEGTGVYLYDSPNYISKAEPLKVIDTMISFSEKDFNEKTQSIKFVNPENSQFKFGAVIFAKNVNHGLGAGYELRGNCSFALNNIADLGVVNGQENKPAIGKNNLSSILIFKTKSGSASVKLYNSIGCIKRSDEYGKQKEENNVCTINSSDGFKNIKEACPNFKGDVISIQTTSDVGVLFKASDKDQPGRCQFLESNNSGCINTVKYGYTYTLDMEKYAPVVTSQSFMLFPLVK